MLLCAASDAHHVWYVGSGITRFDGRDASASAGPRGGPDARASRMVLDCRQASAPRPIPVAQPHQVPAPERAKEGTVSDERAGRFRWLERGEGEPVLLPPRVRWAGWITGRSPSSASTAMRAASWRSPCTSSSAGCPRPPSRPSPRTCAPSGCLELPRVVLGGTSLGGHVGSGWPSPRPSACLGWCSPAPRPLRAKFHARGAASAERGIRAGEDGGGFPRSHARDRGVGRVRPGAWSLRPPPRCGCFGSPAPRVGTTSRRASPSSARRPCWCGAGRTASRRRRWPSASRGSSGRAELLYISACGYAPMLEWPDLFAAAVARSAALRGSGVPRCCVGAAR